MAPVAPDCTYVEQHGPVLSTGSGKRVLAPLMPLDGLMHRRTEVRRRGSGQGIGSGVRHLARIPCCPRDCRTHTALLASHRTFSFVHNVACRWLEEDV